MNGLNNTVCSVGQQERNFYQAGDFQIAGLDTGGYKYPADSPGF
jgi:hypothetical protein